MTHELIKVFDGYQIRKKYGKRYLYIAGYRDGEYKYVTDYTYGRHYTLKTAKKHLAALDCRKDGNQ